jgi:DNA polymerase-3 subunit alpha
MSGSDWFHAHAHSEFSCNDAIQRVPDMVGRAAGWGQPAVALTDHGNMSGTVQLYMAGKKHGVQVFPGFEGYLVEDVADKEAKRHHFGLLATDLRGYRALAGFSSLSHTRPRFHKFPRHDFADLADLAAQGGADSLVLLTGCYFGLVQQTLVAKGFSAARAIVEMYAGWFPNTVVEVQNHNIDHPDGFTDDDLVDQLIGIADQMGLPVMATQDSHYLKPGDKAAHDIMKKMVYRNGESNEFPGDSFHFASTEWVQRHYTREQWAYAEEGARYILDLHDLEMPALDEFHAYVPQMSKTPKQDLRDKAYAGLNHLQVYTERTQSKYRDRLLYEFGIINGLGYANYFLHVLDIVEFCNKRNIVVETRGSGNASLVGYCLGITQSDPLFWGLTFERFMSPDRQEPPDFDLDVEDERRGEVVAYIRNKYGAVTIGNYGSLGAREEDDKGSVLVTYNSYLRSIMSPAAFNAKYGTGLDTIQDVRAVNRKDYEGLRRLSKAAARRSYGTHASGLLLPGGHLKLEDYVPTMLVASSDTVVTQFTMDDVHQLGFLKDDVLGQRTLWVMARCQELMGRAKKSDFSWIPLDDAETCTFLSKGIVSNAVFQFEGYAMAKGAKTMGIRNTRDCILAASLFRPACMESGVTDLYLKRRANRALRANIRYPHKAFEDALKSTFGCVLFQEQVLQIMRGLGLDYAGINTFFRIVKDSGKGATARNVERAAEVRKTWTDICQKNGITDVDGAWHFVEGYVKYGFNQAHATGYGLRSYRCAYLKTKFPLEFMTAALESVAGKNTKPDKEVLYTREARRMGLRILPPDISVSGAKWTMDPRRKAITKGLGSIKGVSVAKALELVAQRPEGGWGDAQALAEAFPAGVLSGRNQYLDLVSGKTKRDGTPAGGWIGTMKALKEAGALESLGVGKDD